MLEKGLAAHLEITFHLVDLDEREDKSLATGDTLDCEKALVETRQPIATELETIVELDTIMDQGSRVDN